MEIRGTRRRGPEAAARHEGRSQRMCRKIGGLTERFCGMNTGVYRCDIYLYGNSRIYIPLYKYGSSRKKIWELPFFFSQMSWDLP